MNTLSRSILFLIIFTHNPSDLYPQQIRNYEDSNIFLIKKIMSGTDSACWYNNPQFTKKYSSEKIVRDTLLIKGFISFLNDTDSITNFGEKLKKANIPFRRIHQDIIEDDTTNSVWCESKKYNIKFLVVNTNGCNWVSFRPNIYINCKSTFDYSERFIDMYYVIKYLIPVSTAYYSIDYLQSDGIVIYSYSTPKHRHLKPIRVLNKDLK